MSSLPTQAEAKFLLKIDDPEHNQTVIGAALRLLKAYAEGVISLNQDTGPLMEAAEEARDLLREADPGTEEWNLSWSLEGALNVARGRDPLTGAPISPEVTAVRVAKGLTVFRIDYKQPMELDAPCCEECDGIHPHG